MTSDFRTAVSEKNTLRVRIMIKNSFLIDPTFEQLEEMLAYASKNLPDLIIDYDGGYLENDWQKWNYDSMNKELTQLVTNFSQKRLDHLKSVVDKVLQRTTVKIGTKQIAVSSRKKIQNHPKETVERYRISQTLKKEANKLQDDLDKMEQTAKTILKAVQDYRELEDKEVR